MEDKGTCRVQGRNGLFNYVFEDGVLESLAPMDPGQKVKSKDGKDPHDLWLSPGLFDIQVNGMLGHEFSSGDITVEHVFEIGEKFMQRGITRWFPTVTTQDSGIVEHSLEVISDAIEKGAPGALAIHMEGHYISSQEGYRGVHMPEFIRDPDIDEFNRWQERARGHIGLFSLAPERENSLSFIRFLRNKGVRVGLVHHNADYQRVKTAVASGANLASHLVNGCSKLIHRQHNVIWAQLSLEDMWASFIADGYHIPSYTLLAVIRSKGVDKTILISDLAHLSGLPDGEYQKHHNTVVLKDGGLWVKDKGTDLLSGAVKTLDRGCEYIVKNVGFDIDEALLMASYNPMRYYGLEEKAIPTVGDEGPFVLFSWTDNSLTVERIMR